MKERLPQLASPEAAIAWACGRIEDLDTETTGLERTAEVVEWPSSTRAASGSASSLEQSKGCSVSGIVHWVGLCVYRAEKRAVLHNCDNAVSQ